MIANGRTCQSASNIKRVKCTVVDNYANLTAEQIESMDYWQKKKAVAALSLSVADQKQETLTAALLEYINTNKEE